MMSGNQKDHSLAVGDCPFERAVDGPPSCIEVHSVEIDDTIGLNPARTEPLVPAPVKCCSKLLTDPKRQLGPRRVDHSLGRAIVFGYRWLGLEFFTG